MCLEHKQYWQCCLTIDSTYIDPCPLADVGERCSIEERVHPIGGYCYTCRRSRNKVEDDVCTNPLYTKNDGYRRPWEQSQSRPKPSRHVSEQSYYRFDEPKHKPETEYHRHKSQSTANQPKYKPIKSQPLVFPTRSYTQPAPERGRSLRRPSSPPNELNDPLPIPSVPKHIYRSTYQPPSPPSSSSSDDDCDDLRHRKYHHKDHKHHYHNKGTSKSKHKEYRGRTASPEPEPVQYRVASPRTVRRLQRQGILPPMEQLQALAMQSWR